jgi:transcriptional regulator with XRE-family HTH domain
MQTKFPSELESGPQWPQIRRREGGLHHFDPVKNLMKTSNFIDRHVGARLRFLRQDRGVTPDVLSRILGISPNRLDDLEEGRERISADMMRVLSRVLRAPPSAFFEGFSVTAAGLVRLTNDDAQAANDEERLLRDFARIRDHDARQLVLTLVSSYAAFEGMAKG